MGRIIGRREMEKAGKGGRLCGRRREEDETGEEGREGEKGMEKCE